jgi:hypothetical protein
VRRRCSLVRVAERVPPSCSAVRMLTSAELVELFCEKIAKESQKEEDQVLSELARSSSFLYSVSLSSPLRRPGRTLKAKFLRTLATPGADSYRVPALRTRVREAVPFVFESTEAILTLFDRSPTVTRDRRPSMKGAEERTRRWEKVANDMREEKRKEEGQGWDPEGDAALFLAFSFDLAFLLLLPLPFPFSSPSLLFGSCLCLR